MFADSGALVHMMRNKNHFLTYEAFSSPKEVRIGKDNVILAHGLVKINVEMKV